MWGILCGYHGLSKPQISELAGTVLCVGGVVFWLENRKEGCPGVRITCFHCRELGSSWIRELMGGMLPHASWHSQKKKEIK